MYLGQLKHLQQTSIFVLCNKLWAKWDLYQKGVQCCVTRFLQSWVYQTSLILIHKIFAISGDWRGGQLLYDKTWIQYFTFTNQCQYF